jgi:hypothetical protein
VPQGADTQQLDGLQWRRLLDETDHRLEPSLRISGDDPAVFAVRSIGRDPKEDDAIGVGNDVVQSTE